MVTDCQNRRAKRSCLDTSATFSTSGVDIGGGYSNLLENLAEHSADRAAGCLNSKQRGKRWGNIVDGNALLEETRFDMRSKENDWHVGVVPVRRAVRRP